MSYRNPHRLRLAFMGTPDFALPSLHALAESGHEIVCVYTQPARKKGRGKRVQESPVANCARDLEIPVKMPTNLNNKSEHVDFNQLNIDLCIVVAYGILLPSAIINAPRISCINLHASLLPRWRGAAPIQRAIMAGDDKTGVCLMQMTEGLDEGPVFACKETKITQNDTYQSLHDRLSTQGASLLSEYLPKLAGGQLYPHPQATTGICYAKKISKSESRIDWNLPSENVMRLINGLSPFPGAWFSHEGKRFKVLLAKIEECEKSISPGTLADDNLLVKCLNDAVRITRIQMEGARAMEANSFLNGQSFPAGLTLS